MSSVQDTPSKWHDVTDLLSSVSSKLPLGDMVHASDFSLHAAMSALEIGDGVIDAGQKGRILYLDSVLANKPLLEELFSIESDATLFVCTLDELLRLLWSFLNGNADQFSIYSCLYVHDAIRDHEHNSCKQLQAFVDAVKLCCGLAREMVTSSSIVEDDDWSKIKQFSLLDTSNVTTKELINTTTAKLQHIIDSLQAPASKTTKPEVKSAENSSPTPNQTLGYRFEFIAGLLRILYDMYRITQLFPDAALIQSLETPVSEPKQEAKTSQESSSSSTPNSNSKPSNKQARSPKKRGNKQPRKAKQKQKQKQAKPQSKKKPQNKQKQQKHASKPSTSTLSNPDNLYLLELNPSSPCRLPSSTITLHKQLTSSLKPASSSLLRTTNALLSTASVSPIKKLVSISSNLGNDRSTHAPRKQRIPPLTTTFQHFRIFFKTLRKASHITNLTSFNALLTFLDSLSHSRSPSPNIVIRSFLSTLIEHSVHHSTFLHSSLPLTHFIQTSFKTHSRWCHIFGHTAAQYLADYDTLFSRVETALKDVIRQKLLHPCRQLEWSRRILKNWSILGAEAPEIDRLTAMTYVNGFEERYHEQIARSEEFKPCRTAFGGWVTCQCVDSMVFYVYSGFNEEIGRLFASYELVYVYWYLGELLGVKRRVMEECGSVEFEEMGARRERVKEAMNPAYRKMRERRRKKEGVKKEEKRRGGGVKETWRWMKNEGERWLCVAVWELLMCLEEVDVVEWEGRREDGKRLGDEELRYMHRFEMFAHVREVAVMEYVKFRKDVFEFGNGKGKGLREKFEAVERKFEQASRCFGVVQKGMKPEGKEDVWCEEWVKEARKVAVVNKIFVSKLWKMVSGSAGGKESVGRIRHRFDIHTCFAEFYFDKK